eukprot:c19701_g1_i1 orf=121-447(+)
MASSGLVVSLVPLLTLLILVVSAANLKAVQAARVPSTVDIPQEANEAKRDGEVAFPAALCGQDSKTYSGVCTSSTGCDNTCKSKEHASAGSCHVHHLVNPRCYCYFPC